MTKNWIIQYEIATEFESVSEKLLMEWVRVHIPSSRQYNRGQEWGKDMCLYCNTIHDCDVLTWNSVY